MLADEDRRRGEDRHLFALEDGFEGGADGDLGLAVADIAAEEAVHGAVRLHVGLDLRDRPVLVVGEIVFEGVLELALPRGVGRELESARASSNCRQSEQGRGHLADRLLDPRLAFGPGRSSEPVELRAGLAVSRCVLLDEIRAFDGDQEIVASAVGEDQHLEFAVFHNHPAEPVESPDAVIEVDHRVAGSEVAEIGDKGRGAAAPASRRWRGGEIPSAIDREPVANDKAVLDASLDDGNLAHPRGVRNRHHVSLLQEMLETSRLAFRGDHQDLRQILGPAVAQGGDESGDPPGEVLHGAGRDPPPLGLAVSHLELLEAEIGGLEPTGRLIHVEEDPIGRRQGEGTPLQGLPLAILDLPPAVELANCVVAVADHRHIGEIEPVGDLILEVEGGPPELSLGAGAHGFRQSGPFGCEGVRDHRDPFGLGRKRIEGVERDLAQGFAGGALARCVEAADLVDPIVVEDDPERVVATVVNIDHPSPDGELAGLLDKVDSAIAGRGESLRQVSLVKHLARHQPFYVRRDRLGQGQRPEESTYRNHHHPDVAIGHPPQQSDQLESRCEGWFGALVGGAEIARNPSHPEVGGEELEPGREIIDLRNVGHHHRHESGFPPIMDKGCHSRRTRAGNHAPDGQRSITTAERLDQRGQIGKGKGWARNLHSISAGNCTQVSREAPSRRSAGARGSEVRR